MMDDNGVEFGCPPGRGYNYTDLANILDNVHDYIGKRATFTYFERTKAGNYRHPLFKCCLLYTSPSPRDRTRSRMPSSA